jgi:hypothetical protein
MHAALAPLNAGASALRATSGEPSASTPFSYKVVPATESSDSFGRTRRGAACAVHNSTTASKPTQQRLKDPVDINETTW